jgi:hypothetical protein
MIHFIKEGEHLHIGLNIKTPVGFKWPWISFVWCWHNLEKLVTYAYMLRFRTCKRPFIITESGSWPTLENYLFDRDLVVVSRDLYEDYKVHFDKIKPKELGPREAEFN